ncbi:hypothetical protein BU23DRAFT_575283 [Bimuria novae-zelandiae CBS 107.79]|uniref:Uncharacterized protein n=1 Tax=Bimuria novae-zelandiae CBS 107.79 TaxID=1447943 RepID=A0A6A5UIC1_9PLEO|nr:hypothetical protein BU23DRAFT_575283 [Bimuria novae-zelandiae CBS 107.79]
MADAIAILYAGSLGLVEHVKPQRGFGAGCTAEFEVVPLSWPRLVPVLGHCSSLGARGTIFRQGISLVERHARGKRHNRPCFTIICGISRRVSIWSIEIGCGYLMQVGRIVRRSEVLGARYGYPSRKGEQGRLLILLTICHLCGQRFRRILVAIKMVDNPRRVKIEIETSSGGIRLE